MKKFLVILVLLGVAVGGFLVFGKKPQEAKPENPLVANIQTIADQGKNHVKSDTQVEYGSNPPTSGPHYEEWTKAGVYEEPLADGNLVHSLEHGYVIISYNCEQENPECKDLVSKVVAIWEEKGRNKIIVTPRPSLDTKIALTAWTKLDKFDEFDAERINFFIDEFRNKGPERTMEVYQD